ncbi:alpha/beta hydrolase family protein [Coleofasciculus sp. C1-SOL-03]|jgi:alpha/beta superfamily hydrolase|uniref:alpha/beta hydrolase family protein n=1 Tax=Coleofasciculus sp. C1-SOL-03 TaxID=3069522 RepID=UPI004062C8B4
MLYPSTKTQSSVALVGACFITLGTGIPAAAGTFNPAPLFEDIQTYSTTITTNGDAADVYFPALSEANGNTETFPIALMLEGALVDKSDYSNFASTVAQYGFVVVVPNHERTLVTPIGSFTGFFPEQQQVNDVLTYMVEENSNSSSPIHGIVDTDTLGLLGHSFGGGVGLAVIQDICFPGICTGSFSQPPELMAGIFYGTNFRNPPEVGAFPPVDNGTIPTALIAGSRDGVAELFESEATYNQIQNPPKALITVDGANHYGITNEDNPIRDPNTPTIDQAIATETIARWSALFLRSHLLEDADAFNYVYNTGDALDENVTVISQTQPIPEFTSVWSLLAFSIGGTGMIGKCTKALSRGGK